MSGRREKTSTEKTFIVRGEAGLQILTSPLQEIALEVEEEMHSLLTRVACIFAVPPPKLQLSDRGRVFGRYEYGEQLIVLGPRGREVATLLHEFAHHVVALRAQQRHICSDRPHGGEFKQVLRELCLMAYAIYGLPLPDQYLRDGKRRRRAQKPASADTDRPEEGELVLVDGKRFGKFEALVLHPKRTRAFVKRIHDGSLFDVPFALIKRSP